MAAATQDLNADENSCAAWIGRFLKARGIDSRIFDSTFSDLDALESYLKTERPPVVGIYSNLMTRSRVQPIHPDHGRWLRRMSTSRTETPRSISVAACAWASASGFPHHILGKICPHCAKRYDSEATFCGHDGSELVSVN